MLEQNDLQEIAKLLHIALEPVHERLGRLETDVAELKADVKELKERVTVLETDVAELKTDVAVLKTDVAGLKTNVITLNQNMKDMNREIGRLRKSSNSRFDYLDASIEKVDRRLAYNTELLKETDRAIMENMDRLRA